MSTSGQSRRQVDSLLKAIDKDNTDSIQLKLYNRIGDYYMDNNAGKAIEYFEKAQELARKLNRPLMFKLQTMNAVMHTSDMLDNLLAWANVQIKNTQANIVPVSITDCVLDAVSNVQAQAQQKQLTIQQHIDATVALSDYDILSIALRNLLTNAIKFSPVNKLVTVSSSIKEERI
jgi:signal transduction histidine kinase